MSGAAREHGVSWPVAQAAHACHADAVLAAAGFEQERLARRAGVKSLVRVLGIDETRRGRPTWHQDGATGKWRLSQRFETNFVDLGDGHHLGPVPLLGQTAGRTVTAVSGWLDERGQAWKDGVDVVAIDLSATYLAAVTKALPRATVVADHFHVQRLGNQMLTRVRQRVTRERTGRRGLAVDPVWAGRRRLIRAYERLTDAQFVRMWNDLIEGDPTNQVLKAWIVKEQLRRLLACAKTGANRTDVSHRLYDFYRWADTSGLPEAISLAQTVEKWWPQILASIELNISNAGTESTNRQIKTQGRIARGFRNIENQRRRVRYACLPSPRAGHRRGQAMPR